MDLQKSKEKYFLSLLLFAYFALQCCYLDTVPRWDAATYWGGLVEAVNATHAMTNWRELPHIIMQTYNVFGHPAMGYIGLLVLGQLIDYPNLLILNLTNALLATFSVFCVYKIFCWFLPKKSYFVEILLATAIFALDPLFFATSIFLNTDFPVLVFFTAALACLLYGRYGLFTAFSLFMVFSKATGMMYWLSILGGIGLYSALIMFRELRVKRWPSLGQLLPPTYDNKTLTLSANLFRAVCLFSPGIAFKLYSTAQKAGVWADTNALKFDSNGWNCFGFNTRVMINRAGEIFILNFHWLLGLSIIVALLIATGKAIRQRRLTIRNAVINLDIVTNIHDLKENITIENTTEDTTEDIAAKSNLNFSHNYLEENRWWGILPVLMSFLAFITFNLTYITYIIPRYVVHGSFFLVFFTLLSLPLAINSRKIRTSILSLLLILFTLQTFWTIDPLSKLFFGSTSFGKHSILQIDSAGEAQGNGFVYSAAFAAEDKLFNLMHKAMPITPDTTIITWNADPGYAWNTMGGIYIDSTSLNRTIDWRNNFSYKIVDIGHLKYPTAPLTAFYVYMPWLAQFSNEAEELMLLQKYYSISEPTEVQYHGYSLRFYRLTRLAD